MAFEAFVTGRLPSIRCPGHGDVARAASWASDHVLLQGLIGDGNTDQLGGTSAAPSRAMPVHLGVRTLPDPVELAAGSAGRRGPGP
jgi:hypothetical protein